MAQEKEKDAIPKKDEELTGSDIPGGTGKVSDEDINTITDDGSGKKIGQDHSLENYGESMPDSGVGAVQDNSDTTSDIARIEE